MTKTWSRSSRRFNLLSDPELDRISSVLPTMQREAVEELVALIEPGSQGGVATRFGSSACRTPLVDGKN